MGTQTIPSNFANNWQTAASVILLGLLKGNDQAQELAATELRNMAKLLQSFTAKMPNGLTSWIETHHQIVMLVTHEREQGTGGQISEIYESQGGNGLMAMTEQWADEFEQLHKGEEWEEKDWYIELDAFVEARNAG